MSKTKDNPVTDIVENTILSPASIGLDDIQRTLHGLMTPAMDYADIYFQRRRAERWYLEDGIIRDAGFDLEQGVGVRGISGEKTGLAYSEEISVPALEQVSQSAGSIAMHGQTGRIQVATGPVRRELYSSEDPVRSLSQEDKVALLHMADKAAREADSRVVQVMAALVAVQDVILVAASDDSLSADIRPLVRMSIEVIVEDNGHRERGSAGGGRRSDYAYFTPELVRHYAQEAVRVALVRLQAEAAPAGEMTVVLGPGWPGVLLHEAVGHGLEGDFNRKGTSAYSHRLGEMVADPQCTVVDDGTLPGRRGSLNMDDEGTATQCNTLIEKGRLVGYMQDRHNAHLMGMTPTGNGRRESYAFPPMPRMTNTFMQAGQYDPDEIIASVDRGIYAVNFEGGSVDITSGNFVFSSSESYLIENGKVTRPVKGATLIGNGPKVLDQIAMVGNDLALDEGIGVCGKEGQSVPVGVGQPTLKIKGLTVGGTQ